MECITTEYLKQVMGFMPVGVFLEICTGVEGHQTRVLQMRTAQTEEAIRRLEEARAYLKACGDQMREAADELQKTQNLILGMEVDNPATADRIRPMNEQKWFNVDEAVKQVGLVLGIPPNE